MEMLILLSGLAFVLAALLRTWKQGRAKQDEAARRMQQDVRRFHDDLYKGPTRGRAGRSYGHDRHRW